MTMHLEGPWLSMTGKKRGKKKFRTAEEARLSRELDASWQELQKKWAQESEVKKRNRAMSAQVYSPTPSVHIRDTGPRPPSLPDTVLGAVNSKPPQKYTGTLIKGIATMHKSNAVPVLNDEDAIALAHMRR